MKIHHEIDHFSGKCRRCGAVFYSNKFTSKEVWNWVARSGTRFVRVSSDCLEVQEFVKVKNSAPWLD
jgi:hypothetical protein